MKKILVALSLLALVGCDDASGGGKLAITKHENGKIASRGYVIPTALRHPNAAGIEPIKVGEWVYFYEDGQKEKQGTYIEDQMEGVWIKWEDGFKYEETYKNGELEGDWTGWHPNGQKAGGGTYKGGQKEGVWTYLDDNGQKWGEFTYKDGKEEGVYTWWHDNGQKKREGTHKNGKKEGVWNEWYANGQAVNFGRKKASEGTYKDDKKDGVWTYWDDNCNVTKTETYMNGRLVK